MSNPGLQQRESLPADLISHLDSSVVDTTASPSQLLSTGAQQRTGMFIFYDYTQQ